MSELALAACATEVSPKYHNPNYIEMTQAAIHEAVEQYVPREISPALLNASASNVEALCADPSQPFLTIDVAAALSHAKYKTDSPDVDEDRVIVYCNPYGSGLRKIKDIHERILQGVQSRINYGEAIPHSVIAVPSHCGLQTPETWQSVYDTEAGRKQIQEGDFSAIASQIVDKITDLPQEKRTKVEIIGPSQGGHLAVAVAVELADREAEVQDMTPEITVVTMDTPVAKYDTIHLHEGPDLSVYAGVGGHIAAGRLGLAFLREGRSLGRYKKASGITLVDEEFAREALKSEMEQGILYPLGIVRRLGWLLVRGNASAGVETFKQASAVAKVIAITAGSGHINRPDSLYNGLTGQSGNELQEVHVSDTNHCFANDSRGNSAMWLMPLIHDQLVSTYTRAS